MLEIEPGQRPALRAVLQRHHRIGDPEIDQRLRADDGARAAGAIDDDLGLGIGGDGADAQHQLAVRAADAARNVHLAVFREGPAVDDDEVLPGATHGLEVLRGDVRGVLLVLDQLAEGLARHVDAGIERVARALPRLRPSGQDVHVAIAQRLGPLGCPAGDRFLAAIAQHEPHGRVRHQRRQGELEAAVGQRHREEQMPFAELPDLAHVEQRDFSAVREPDFQRRCVDGCGHASPPGTHVCSRHGQG